MTTGSHAQTALRKQNLLDHGSGFRLQADGGYVWFLKAEGVSAS